MNPFFLVLAFAILRFGSQAVWQPGSDFRQSVDSKCRNRGDEFGRCFADQMKQTNASAEAMAFTHAVHDNGYMQAFRPVGPVAIASVIYPFRANENSALLIINGQPSLLDVDSLDARQVNQMKTDPRYQAVLRDHKNAALWPGDRSSVDSLLALGFSDGSREFVAEYQIQNGCHACAVLGKAFFGFHFDRDGKMMFVRFTGFQSFPRGIEVSPQKIVRLMPQKIFTILLPENQTTGYSWALSPARDQGGPKLLQHSREQNGKGIGRGGEDRWTFRAPETGEYKLSFSYKRPWEKNAAAARLTDILVVVM